MGERVLKETVVMIDLWKFPSFKKKLNYNIVIINYIIVLYHTIFNIFRVFNEL